MNFKKLFSKLKNKKFQRQAAIPFLVLGMFVLVLYFVSPMMLSGFSKEITVKVVDSAGNPLSGAQVYLYVTSLEPDWHPKSQWPLLTSSTGKTSTQYLEGVCDTYGSCVLCSDAFEGSVYFYDAAGKKYYSSFSGRVCTNTLVTVTLNVDGGASSPSCTDSDGGKNIYTAGTAKDSTGNSVSDSCFTASSVKEAICSAVTASSSVISCPSGYSCKDGACVEQASSICVDSDNGKDVYKLGTIYLLGMPTQFDVCYSSSQVAEWYCEGSTPRVSYISCASGYQCVSGICVRKTTTTTKAATTTTKAATTTTKATATTVYTTSTTLSAECANGETLEYTCGGGDVVEQCVCVNNAWSCKSVTDLCEDNDEDADYLPMAVILVALIGGIGYVVTKK